MENQQTIQDDFKNEMDQVLKQNLFNARKRKIKLTLWLVRNSISTLLYFIFWDHTWVRWTLYLTVPLAAISLFTIIGLPIILNRKIEKTKEIIEKAEEL